MTPGILWASSAWLMSTSITDTPKAHTKIQALRTCQTCSGSYRRTKHVFHVVLSKTSRSRISMEQTCRQPLPGIMELRTLGVWISALRRGYTPKKDGPVTGRLQTTSPVPQPLEIHGAHAQAKAARTLILDTHGLNRMCMAKDTGTRIMDRALHTGLAFRLHSPSPALSVRSNNARATKPRSPGWKKNCTFLTVDPQTQLPNSTIAR